MNGALPYLSYLWDLGFGGAKRWGNALKSPFRVAMQATSGGRDNFNGEGGREVPTMQKSCIETLL